MGTLTLERPVDKVSNEGPGLPPIDDFGDFPEWGNPKCYFCGEGLEAGKLGSALLSLRPKRRELAHYACAHHYWEFVKGSAIFNKLLNLSLWLAGGCVLRTGIPNIIFTIFVGSLIFCFAAGPTICRYFMWHYIPEDKLG